MDKVLNKGFYLLLLLLKAKFFYKEVEKRLKKNGDITILIAYDFF